VVAGQNLMSNPFSDAAMAAGYATARPPVHPSVVALLRAWRRGARAGIAADIGCGAGLSTRALVDVAERCVGFDPSESMIRAARCVSPGARFVVASAEAMPLASGTVELLTAAGSLNYVRALDAVWPEARRVLTRRGALAVYDFSTGRSFAGGPELDEWFDAFVARYPYPRSQARPLSPEILSDVAEGFAVDRADTFDLPLPMTCESYVSYLLTETNVQEAVRAGASLESVRSWCTTGLSPLFAGRVKDVTFRGYLACLTALA
jgi:SAM-dependent methyltransferase